MQWPLCADTRSLVAFRISLGCVVAAEAAWLLPNARDLLSDTGLLPLRTMHAMHDEADDPGANRWSLCWASGGVWWQWLLLVALLCCGVSTAVGFKSNLATGAAWVIMASVHRRNPLMVHGGDVLLRMLLLLATFAPLDHGVCMTDESQSTSTKINTYDEGTAAKVNASTGSSAGKSSTDSRTETNANTDKCTRKSSDMSTTTKMSSNLSAGPELTNGDTAHRAAQKLTRKTYEVKSVGLAVLMLQPLLMYHMAGALKNGPEWREDFTAVYFAMKMFMVTKYPADVLLKFPELMRFASILVPPFEEFIGPLLLLCPLAPLRTPSRILALCIFTLMQTGFFLTVVLGTFPWISTVSVLTFVPGEVWDTVIPIVDPLVSAARRNFLWVTAVVLHKYHRTVRALTAFAHQAAVADASSTSTSSAQFAKLATIRLSQQVFRTPPGVSGTPDALAAELPTETDGGPADGQACASQKSGVAACEIVRKDCIWTRVWRYTSRVVPVGISLWILAHAQQQLCAAGSKSAATSDARCSVLMSGAFHHLEGFGQLLSLHQSWDLFAPSPSRSGGYWLIFANVTNGTRTEVYSDLASRDLASPHMPGTHSAWYGGSHYLQYYLRIWQHYRMTLEHDKMPSLELLGALGRYHCFLSARRLPVDAVDIVFVHTPTPAPGESLIFEIFHLWTQQCLHDFDVNFRRAQHEEQCGADGSPRVMLDAGRGHRFDEFPSPHIRFEKQQDEYDL